MPAQPALSVASVMRVAASATSTRNPSTRQLLPLASDERAAVHLRAHSPTIGHWRGAVEVAVAVPESALHTHTYTSVTPESRCIEAQTSCGTARNSRPSRAQWQRSERERARRIAVSVYNIINDGSRPSGSTLFIE